MPHRADGDCTSVGTGRMTARRALARTSVMCSSPACAAPVVSRNATSSVSTAPRVRVGLTSRRCNTAGPSMSDAGVGSGAAKVPVSAVAPCSPAITSGLRHCARTATATDASLHCLIENRGLRDHDVVLNVADKLRQDQTGAGGEHEHPHAGLCPVGGGHLAQRRRKRGVAGNGEVHRVRQHRPTDGGQRQQRQRAASDFIAAVIQLIQDKTPQLGAGCVVRGCDPRPARLWQWRPAATPRTPG